ncbi:MAG: substrate-binding domain-containing protein [Thermodesulfobacteriota bacterium]|nr:substrate-binding domain-containing protein [Thermodesulfobacteriota bacterium]
MNKEMLNTKEVANYLNINEKQVYRLIKEKKIPATRITGKWTFPRRLIDEWIIQSARDNIGHNKERIELKDHIVIMGSNDFTTELLSHELNKRFPEFSLSFSNVGSVGGLIALSRGSSHIASCHLLDPDTGRYNLPYLEQYLPDLESTVVNLVYRDLCLIVRPGNPSNIKGIEDLARSSIRIVNRQHGSGTRIFLDFELKRLGINPKRIQGYEEEVNTHIEVAMMVLSGVADVGLGILSAARMLDLEFIHITRERYDLVIPKENISVKPITALLEVIGSQEFKEKVEQMGGYNTKDSGRIMSQ